MASGTEGAQLDIRWVKSDFQLKDEDRLEAVTTVSLTVLHAGVHSECAVHMLAFDAF
ncbi:hypothetical protein [Nitratireductor aquibiodomus]|uniref:hypothetical protein n=1 Tax=Nitratireductor aquibiodomus TaxID=204799 RepID=UPI000AD34CC0|nr:hypothetical protein [Nitratireductor aquibiodomus]